MPNNFRLSTSNIYNQARSTTNSTNKENRPNNLLQMNRNAFATPSEDDFDDDDDELLIAASQQVEKKLAIEKAQSTTKDSCTLKLQGEIAILRDQNLKLSREKEQQRIEKAEEIKLIEQKYRRDLETMNSRLEFKDRDIEELKSKIQADSARNDSSSTQSAKRPRLSVVRDIRSSEVNNSVASSCQTNSQFRIRNFQTPPSTFLSSFCCLNLKELNNDTDQKNLKTLYSRLKNNPDTQKRFNIKPSLQKSASSKEVQSVITQLFVHSSVLSSWDDRKICLQILSVLLQHNTHPNIDHEVKKLLTSLQTAGSADEHSVISETIHNSGVNVLSFCSQGTGTCGLRPLFRHKCDHVIRLLIGSLSRVPAVVPRCSCSNWMVKYVCEMILGCLEGELTSAVVEISDHCLLIQCLQLLTYLAPFFPEMKLSGTSQTMFFGSLSHLKKCQNLSMSGLAMVEGLHEAIFELNNSMNMSE